MSRLTVTVIAWNEEERLRACLESVAWADEILLGLTVALRAGGVRVSHDRAWSGSRVRPACGVL